MSKQFKKTGEPDHIRDDVPQDRYKGNDDDDYRFEARGGPAANDNNHSYDQQTHGRPPQGYAGLNQGRQGW